MSAAFTTPKLLTPFIPTGFVIDEKYSSTQNVGMFTGTNIVARKVNQLPKPFVTPEFSELLLGYTEITDSSYLSMMWNEAQQNAEKESQSQTNPNNTFIGKEVIPGGGVIYWYQGMHFNGEGAKDEATQITFYRARIIKQVNNGILSIKITDFVGERDIIRKCFQLK